MHAQSFALLGARTGRHAWQKPGVVTSPNPQHRYACDEAQDKELTFRLFMVSKQ